MKTLTITTKYLATKMTCKQVVEDYDDIGHMDFYDPADEEIHAVYNCPAWFQEQRKNKVVWILEEVEREKMTWGKP